MKRILHWRILKNTNRSSISFFGNNKNALNSLFGSNCTDDNDDSSDDEDDASME